MQRRHERPARSRASFVAGIGAGLGGAAVPRRVAAQAVKLRVSGAHSDPFGEQLYAKEAGAFARAGFDLDVITLTNGSAVVAALSGGSLDLGVGDLISGVIAINAGVPNVLVAGSGLYISSEDQIIIATANESPIRRPSDLNGKTIGVPTLVGLTTAALRAWLPQNGVGIYHRQVRRDPGGSDRRCVAARHDRQRYAKRAVHHALSHRPARGRPADGCHRERVLHIGLVRVEGLDRGRSEPCTPRGERHLRHRPLGEHPPCRNVCNSGARCSLRPRQAEGNDAHELMRPRSRLRSSNPSSTSQHSPRSSIAKSMRIR